MSTSVEGVFLKEHCNWAMTCYIYSEINSRKLAVSLGGLNPALGDRRGALRDRDFAPKQCRERRVHWNRFLVKYQVKPATG